MACITVNLSSDLYRIRSGRRVVSDIVGTYTYPQSVRFISLNRYLIYNSRFYLLNPHPSAAIQRSTHSTRSDNGCWSLRTTERNEIPHHYPSRQSPIATSLSIQILLVLSLAEPHLSTAFSHGQQQENEQGRIASTQKAGSTGTGRYRGRQRQRRQDSGRRPRRQGQTRSRNGQNIPLPSSQKGSSVHIGHAGTRITRIAGTTPDLDGNDWLPRGPRCRLSHQFAHLPSRAPQSIQTQQICTAQNAKTTSRQRRYRSPDLVPDGQRETSVAIQGLTVSRHPRFNTIRQLRNIR